MNSSASSSVVFKPFWFLETMMSFYDRVGWARYGEAMVNYKLGDNFIKGIPAYFGAFTIFILGNLGTRVLALFYVAKNIIRKELQSGQIRKCKLFQLRLWEKSLCQY